MGKSWTPIDCHCKNFNSLILNSHTWNIVKKCPKSDLQALKIWLGHFLTMFHLWEFRIKLLKFLQWQSMGVHDFPIVKIGLMGTINHCFNNKSQTDPSPWNGSSKSIWTSHEVRSRFPSVKNCFYDIRSYFHVLPLSWKSGVIDDMLRSMCLIVTMVERKRTKAKEMFG